MPKFFQDSNPWNPLTGNTVPNPLNEWLASFTGLFITYMFTPRKTADLIILCYFDPCYFYFAESYSV